MADSLLESLLIEDQRIFSKLNVDLQPTGLFFKRKLNQKQMRAVWWLLMNVRKGETKEGYIDWAIGDWMVKAKEWFSEELAWKWIEEEKKLRAFRDYLLRQTGAALIQIQHLEYTINICCSFLSLKARGKKIKLTHSDFLSPDRKHRTEALGTLKNALLETEAFDFSFETRLSTFVDNRNHFIHHFWMDIFRRSSGNGPPTWARLREVEKFVCGLLIEATALQAPFRGLFYSIGKGISKKENEKLFRKSDLFTEFSRYEEDFLSILRQHEKDDK